MAILELADVKAALRIDTITEADDATVLAQIARATALVEAYNRGEPIERRTVVRVAEARPAVDPITYAILDRGALGFDLYYAHVDPATVTVRGPDGVAVDSSNYAVDGRAGTVTAIGAAFAPGPHTLTADAGLELADDYEAADRPVMQAAVQDYVAWYFEQRNPAAEYEAAGGGVATTFNKSADAGLPARIRTALDHWRASKAVPLRRRPIPSRV